MANVWRQFPSNRLEATETLVLGNSALVAEDFWEAPTGGTNYELTPVGVSADSTVGQTTLGTVHALSPLGLASAASVGNPGLSQLHALLPAGVFSSSSASATSLGQLHALVPVAVLSQSTVGQPTLSVTTQYALAPLGVYSVSSTGPATLSQVHVIVPVGIDSLAYAGLATLSEETEMAVTTASNGRVYKLTAASDTISGKQFIRMVRWVGATTAAHALELRCGAYGANDIIYADVAAAANHVRETTFDPPLIADNVKVQTLGSGTVYLYI